MHRKTQIKKCWTNLFLRFVCRDRPSWWCSYWKENWYQEESNSGPLGNEATLANPWRTSLQKLGHWFLLLPKLPLQVCCYCCFNLFAQLVCYLAHFYISWDTANILLGKYNVWSVPMTFRFGFEPMDWLYPNNKLIDLPLNHRRLFLRGRWWMWSLSFNFFSGSDNERKRFSRRSEERGVCVCMGERVREEERESVCAQTREAENWVCLFQQKAFIRMNETHLWNVIRWHKIEETKINCFQKERWLEIFWQRRKELIQRILNEIEDMCSQSTRFL